METFERRLPVYLLLDCSESMVGEGIEGVNAGMRQLLLDLFSDPHALETVWVSAITFADTAQQVMPLTELTQVKAPKLKVRPGTSMGAALKLLRECVSREVREHSAQFKGDWKPLVFLLTDGSPTDEWREEARRVREVTSSGGRKMNLVAIGCGEDVDPLALMELTDSVLMMGDKPGDFRALFQWISSSLSVASQGLQSPSTPGALSLAKPPEGLFDAPPQKEQIERAVKLPPQLFLSVRCSEMRRPFLARYRFVNEYGGYYEAVRTHVVDEDYFAGQGEVKPMSLNVSSERVIGVKPCPHCDNRAAGSCPACGQVFCAPEDDRPVQCPGCLRNLGYGGPGGEFSLSGRMG